MANQHRNDRATLAKLQRECDGFNAKFFVGATVAYREVLDDHCPVQIFTTRTEAQILSGHSAVVWLNGKSGCVLISHVREATPADMAADEIAKQAAFEKAAKDAAAAAQVSAVPYFMPRTDFMLLRAGQPAVCRRREFMGDRTDMRLYEQPFVEALVKSVSDLMHLATRNDVPETEQLAIAERAQALLDKFEADEPIPF